MEKRCTACGRSLPLAEFYRKVDGADGLMARCKACHKAAVQRHHAAHPERKRASRAAYNRAHTAERRAYLAQAKERPDYWAKVAARVRRWRERNPERDRAHSLVAYALKTGRLTRPANCTTCGAAGAVQAHHEDYARPLDVAWLCRPCHLALHGRLGDES